MRIRFPRLSVALAIGMALTLAGCAGAGPSSPATPVPSPSVATSPPPTPTPSPVGPAPLSTWSLTQLAAQVLVVPAQAGSVSSVTPEVRAGIGGVLLLGASGPADLAAQLRALSAAAPSGEAPLIMTDEEGGAVQRLVNLLGTLPSARQMGATMTPAQIQGLGRTTGERLRGLGINMDLAPVLDVDGGAGPNANDPDGTRSFSARESVAAADGIAFARGLLQAGVTPVVKHFPGLGGSSGNTDYRPASTRPWAELQGNGLLPFADAVSAGLPDVMVSNATVPGLTAVPSSISGSVIQGVLRDRLGFTGLVMTDSLSAGALGAIGYSVPRAAVAALEAGADLLLFTAAPAQVATEAAQTEAAIVAAVNSGSLPRADLEAAVAQVLAAKSAAAPSRAGGPAGG